MALQITSPAAPSSSRVTGAFAYLYIAWGITFIGIHCAVETIPPLMMCGSRFMLAGSVMLILLRVASGANFHWGTLREWKDAGLVALLLLVVGNGTQAWCQKFVPTGVTALLFSTIPLWIVLFDWIRPGGLAPPRRVVFGLLLGFAGVVVLVNPHDTVPASGSIFGDEIMLLVSACSFAAGGVYSRYVQARGSPLLPMARQMLIGGTVLLLVSTLHGDWHGFSPAQISLTSWEGFFYLVTFGSLLGFTLYVWLMRVSTPARVATISYVNLLVAVILGWLLLHEPMTWRLILGTAITASSVILVLRKVKRVHEMADE